MVSLIILLAVLALVGLISWGKVQPFVAFLLVSLAVGLALGLPPARLMAAVYQGLGDALGSVVVVIVLGAMLGKLVADSGAAQQIATVMLEAFGLKYIQWTLMVTGLIIGVPLFYNVGFVLVVPLIFSVAYKYRLPAVYVGLPMLASLSVLHGFLPPHPAPRPLPTVAREGHGQDGRPQLHRGRQRQHRLQTHFCPGRHGGHAVFFRGAGPDARLTLRQHSEKYHLH